MKLCITQFHLSTPSVSLLRNKTSDFLRLLFYQVSKSHPKHHQKSQTTPQLHFVHSSDGMNFKSETVVRQVFANPFQKHLCHYSDFRFVADECFQKSAHRFIRWNTTRSKSTYPMQLRIS